MEHVATPTFAPDFGGESTTSAIASRFTPRAPEADGWAPALPRPVPPLLADVAGANKTTTAHVIALEALMLARFEAGYLHTCAELDDAEDEADLDVAFRGAMRIEEAAALALLNEDVQDPVDRHARVTAYLRSRALFQMPVREWRQLSAAEAVDRLDEEELAPAFKYLLGTASAHAPSAYRYAAE